MGKSIYHPLDVFRTEDVYFVASLLCDYVGKVLQAVDCQVAVEGQHLLGGALDTTTNLIT